MKDITDFIHNLYNTKGFIPLHEPKFHGNEKKYLNDCIDSTFVSSVGKYVDKFEQEFAKAVGSKYAIATINGTSALHISLLLADVLVNDEVITQPLTFVATCNAINYCGAKPVFIDVNLDTMGMSPKSLKSFLNKHCKIIHNKCINTITGNIIKACVPMHTFGHPCRIDKIAKLCKKWNIILIEDSAESLGSYYKEKHTGTFGTLGIFSFNGNKIITGGSGGVIVTDNKKLAIKAKYLTTTAKENHKYKYIHNTIGYNYRMSNLNAALLVAQLEQLDSFILNKREIAKKYKLFFNNKKNIKFISEPNNSKSNYWLQSVIMKNKKEQIKFLKFSNKHGIMTRPIWKLMNNLTMFKDSISTNLDNAIYLEQRVVNIPSSVIN